MTDRRISLIDHDRSACLCDAGGGTYAAATLVADDGRTDLVLVEQELLGDGQSTYLPGCPDAPHEQAGPLPIEYVHRLTVAARRQRGHRCGRRTKSGTTCRIRVPVAGAACEWHKPKVNNT